MAKPRQGQYATDALCAALPLRVAYGASYQKAIAPSPVLKKYAAIGNGKKTRALS